MIKFNKKHFGELTKLIKPEYRFYIYKGGRGGGKSHQIGQSLLSLAQLKPVRILCTREIQNSIKDSVHKLFKDYIALYDLSGFTITDTSIKFTHPIFKWESEFIFKGLNDINDKSSQSIKSLEGIDVCWIEEAQTITKRSLDILIPTIRKKDSLFIVSFNPLLEDDPIQDFVDNPRPRTYIKHVNYYDNPYLDDQQKQDAEFCRIKKPDDYKHIWLGEPLNQKNNAVVKYFSEENIKDFVYADFIDLHISCDFNVDPMSWVVFHRDEKNFYFIDEIVIEGTNVQDTAKEFLNRYPDHKGKIIINGDSSGDNRDAGSSETKFVQLRNALLRHGYKDVEWGIKRGNPRIQNRIDAFNQRIFTDKGERCVFIHSRCKWLIYNCKKLSYKTGTSIIDLPTQTALKNNPESKFLGHIFDAASYPVEKYFPISSDRVENHIKKPKDIWEKHAS